MVKWMLDMHRTISESLTKGACLAVKETTDSWGAQVAQINILKPKICIENWMIYDDMAMGQY